MCRTVLAVCLLTSHVAFSPKSQARPIDDFSVGPFEFLLDIENQSGFVNQNGLPESRVAGGVRRVIASVDGTVGPGIGANAALDTEEKTFTIATSSVSVIEGFHLEYGWGLGNDLNLDLTAFDAFRIDVVSYSGPMFEAGFHFDWGSQLLTVAENTVPFSFLVPFAPWTAPDRLIPLDFGDIDFVRFSGQLPPGAELVLGGIFAVPEPTTVLLLFTGILAIVGRRY